MNVKIRNIEIECPEKIVGNDFYIEHFKKQGKDISADLEFLGKKERRLIEPGNDTTLTLGIKVAKKILKSANLTGKDIDIIFFASQCPEYTFPTQAIIVHNAIGCNKNTMVMDLNVNCLGMISAVDTAVQHLKGQDTYKRALVIGSDYMSIHCKEDDAETYPSFGDCACAVILEKTDEDCGIMGSIYKTNSDECTVAKFPECGSSSLHTSRGTGSKLFWTRLNGGFVPGCANDMFDELLAKKDMKITDIDLFCFSQYASVTTIGIREEMNNRHNLCIPEEKFVYIGDKYGYTGVSSPFVALYEAIKQGRINRGDTILLWSIGLWWTAGGILVKY